jgi:subtilisin family serine protease
MLNAIRYGLNAPHGSGQLAHIIAAKLKADKDQKNFDVVLEPIETVPQIGALSAENWAYKALGVEDNYDYIKTSASRKVVVFVFDTSGNNNHPANQAANKGLSFSSFVNKKDDGGHGTHVAGSYVAVKEGMDIGLCKPLIERDLIELVPVKVLEKGNGTIFVIDQGIKWANEKAQEFISKGYFVIYNFSLGGGSSTWNSTDKLLKQAYDMGVLTVAAAGNTGKAGVNYPGSSQWTLGIGSLTQKGKTLTRSSYSTFGAQVYISTPGESIYSTWLDGGFETISGTSMSTPHAGAVCAIIASCRPKLTNKEIIKLLSVKSVDLGVKGRDEQYGYGLPLLTELLEKTVEVYKGALFMHSIKLGTHELSMTIVGDITGIYSGQGDSAKEHYEDVLFKIKQYTPTFKSKYFYDNFQEIAENISKISDTFKLKSLTCGYKTETYTVEYE